MLAFCHICPILSSEIFDLMNHIFAIILACATATAAEPKSATITGLTNSLSRAMVFTNITIYSAGFITNTITGGGWLAFRNKDRTNYVIDWTPTNLFLVSTHEPVVARSNNTWIISFKP